MADLNQQAERAAPCPLCDSQQVQVCRDSNNPAKDSARCRECKCTAPLSVWNRRAALVVGEVELPELPQRWPERMAEYYNADGSKLMRGTGYFKDAEIAELRAEVERLRAEVKEWLCIDCNTVYPGPPQSGFACVICPKCKGTTMPRQSAEIKKLRAEYAELREASITLSVEVSRLQGAAPAAGTEKDAERLDFMITEECQIEHIARLGAAPYYRVRWPWEGKQMRDWSATPREAIDAAIAAKEPPCSS